MKHRAAVVPFGSSCGVYPQTVPSGSFAVPFKILIGKSTPVNIGKLESTDVVFLHSYVNL